jgi:hypothetical protein
MKNCAVSRITGFIATTVAMIGTTYSAAAATISYNLTGDTNNVSISTGDGNGVYGQWKPGPYISATYGLTNTVTGNDPGFTLFAGDTLNGTITLNNLVTIPANTEGYGSWIGLQGSHSNVIAVLYSDYSVSYYNNGVQVSQSVYGGPQSLSNPVYIFDTAHISDTAQSTAGFAFNEIAFTANVVGFVTNSFQTVTSADVTSYAPQLQVTTFPAPTPLPAAAWLMLSGLGALGALARNKRIA